MSQNPSKTNRQTDLPAPLPCHARVNRTKAYKALLAALGGAGAATVLAASLSAQPAMQDAPIGGGMPAKRLTTAPAPATQPASAPISRPVATAGQPLPAQLVPAPAPKADEGEDK